VRCAASDPNPTDPRLFWIGLYDPEFVVCVLTVRLSCTTCNFTLWLGVPSIGRVGGPLFVFLFFGLCFAFPHVYLELEVKDSIAGTATSSATHELIIAS